MTKFLKDFIKVFILIFLIAFVVIDHQELARIFDYKQVYSNFFDKFKKEISLNFEKEKVEYSFKTNILQIPELNIDVPIIFEESSSTESMENALERGAAFYPPSVNPGEKGTTVILGHSAPFGWPETDYNWIFSNLNDLKTGDNIFVLFDHKKYTYRVVKTEILNKGEEIPLEISMEDTNTLILISCWPPGKNYKRISVLAEQSF